MKTAEIRWFFAGASSFDTFKQSFSFSESSKRVDYYLLDTGERLGVKWREGQVEAKQQQEDSQPYTQTLLAGEVESWKKWSFALSERETYSDDLSNQPQHWIAIHKSRQTASFVYDAIQRTIHPSLPDRQVHDGCNLEITYLTVREKLYTTLGLEAFGHPANLRQNLITTIGYMMENGNLEGLDLSLNTSNNYARWIHTKFTNTTS